MRFWRRTALVVSLFGLSFGWVVASPWMPQSQAQVSFEACTDIAPPIIERVEFMAQQTSGDRTFGLFRVFDGFPEPDYAVQSVDRSGECRVDYWNPSGQPIPITDSETIPSGVMDSFVGLIDEDIAKYD